MFLSSGFFLQFKLFTKYTQTQSAYSSICCHVFLFKCFPKAAQHFPYVPSTLLSHLFFLVAVMLTQAKRNKIPHVTSSRSLLLVPNISYSFINLLLQPQCICGCLLQLLFVENYFYTNSLSFFDMFSSLLSTFIFPPSFYRSLLIFWYLSSESWGRCGALP